MSTQQPTGAPPELPELSERRIDDIEQELFADIARERAADRTRSARRGRLWLAGGAAAAVIVVAAVIAPAIIPLVSPVGGSSESAIEPGIAPDAPVDSGAVDGADGAATSEEDLGGGKGDLSGGSTFTEPDQGEREIITTASATVVVDDVTVAARTVGNSAVAHGGYVEAMSIGTDGEAVPIDPNSGIAYDTYPYPGGAWITVRVPSEDLPAIVDELSDLGEVTASTINRQDVTEQTVDLRARIEAAEASVDRLLDLMAEATTTADLIAAEAALSERQALLESYQQQLESLEGQVAMSSLTVTLTPVVETVEADPAGFTDGVLAGWNGLVATLNGIVIALGFLLPWLAVAAVVGLIVWAIVRWVRGRRERRRADAAAMADAREEVDTP
ncbi:DUF4349 domain-containing protein [Microbacterium sp. SSM24]|uniref:DUF4349 domain-containing protein n=1 Tax=Microbacterium sp. SSM24 TaxID=2991714 RepID=UPI0022260AF8|nr:DUF4349 domain-containing protein [Microbacterium sp. SSM24]MCW3494238.1 DUF4349 domain-containing protein [Microbacterium sp. SSM24]